MPSSADLTLKQKNRQAERAVSLIDALIFRNDLNKAQATLDQALAELGPFSELQQRQEILIHRLGTAAASEEQELSSESIRPVSRQTIIREQKVKTLQNLLHRIQNMRSSQPNTEDQNI